MDIEKVKQIEFYSDDLRERLTIGEYLKRLLLKLWEEDEMFSGKRPFGNSGWQFDIYKTLVEHGFVFGEIDNHGNVDEVDILIADGIIQAVIRSFK